MSAVTQAAAQMRRTGARLEVVQNAAHLPSVERPERFNELLVAFLDRVAQKR